MFKKIQFDDLVENKEILAKELLNGISLLILSENLKTLIERKPKGFEHDLYYKDASWIEQRKMFDIDFYMTGGVTYMGDNNDAINNVIDEINSCEKKIQYVKTLQKCS